MANQEWIFSKGVFGMKTIEERATDYASHSYIEDGNINTYIDELEEQLYIQGATEQKDIDDAELLKLKSSWEKGAQINHNNEANYKQGYHDAIEKACEWITEHIGIPYEGEFVDDIPVASDYIEWCEKRLKYAKAIADTLRNVMEK